MRKPFQFKQFNIHDENSALKLGTDAVLLGAWTNPENSKNILDIGTGCGILALMMAQKTAVQIEAIDIDFDSIKEAETNFRNSSWGENLVAIHSSLSEFVKHSKKKYDLIVSNPPYYNNSLKSSSDRKNLSKHTSFLNHEELLAGVKNLISDNGRFIVIIPHTQKNSIVNIALIEGLYNRNKLIIYPTPSKPANRIILEFSLKKEAQPMEEELTIRDDSGKFTEQYKTLTKDYYLNL